MSERICFDSGVATVTTPAMESIGVSPSTHSRAAVSLLHLRQHLTEDTE